MSFYFLTQDPDHDEVHPDDVAAALTNDESLALLDVRSEAEHNSLRLTNSKNVPVQELSVEALEAAGLGKAAKNKELYVYCRSGGRSAMACAILKDLGYTNVKNISGGLLEWEAAGHGHVVSDHHD